VSLIYQAGSATVNAKYGLMYSMQAITPMKGLQKAPEARRARNEE
jgi:hypothetical protein